MQITRTQKELFIKNSEKKNHLGEYHDLHVQSKTILLADVLEIFQNICLEIYEPKFLSAPE